MTDSLQRVRGFNVRLPDGFIELPMGEQDLTDENMDLLAEEVAALFGADVGSDHITDATVALAWLGTQVGQSGADYSAFALYRSRDVGDRPILLWVSGAVVPSDHGRKELAIGELTESLREMMSDEPMVIGLPVGPAVVTVSEDQENPVVVDGETYPVMQRSVTLWVPDPDGTTLAMISVASPSWRDWSNICELSLEVFKTFEWGDTHAVV